MALISQETSWDIVSGCTKMEQKSTIPVPQSHTKNHGGSAVFDSTHRLRGLPVVVDVKTKKLAIFKKNEESKYQQLNQTRGGG
jgi:hypothetical protein